MSLGIYCKKSNIFGDWQTGMFRLARKSEFNKYKEEVKSENDN